jgi:hypothetical protein
LSVVYCKTLLYRFHKEITTIKNLDYFKTHCPAPLPSSAETFALLSICWARTRNKFLLVLESLPQHPGSIHKIQWRE